MPVCDELQSKICRQQKSMIFECQKLPNILLSLKIKWIA